MSELQSLLFFAQEETFLTRLGTAIIPLVGGVILILIGRSNIKTRTAEPKKTLGGALFDYNKTLEGSGAVKMGWIRIFCGIFMFGVGIYLMAKGSFQ